MTVETIVAVATARGAGGIGVVRLSGPLAGTITESVTQRSLPTARTADLRRFHDTDGAVLDAGIVLLFPAPASFTGEDVAEWQVHGSPVVLDRLVVLAVEAGARIARPGEFTERAFLNGRMDLAQAESVADLITANHLAAARGAARSLEGELSRRVTRLAEELVALRAFIEATIDFPDDDTAFLAAGDVRQRLQSLATTLASLAGDARQGVLLGEGIRVALYGRPNVGKSSLLNALSGRDTAIVTEHAGTTRDVLRESVVLAGLSVTLLDTAGLRDTDEPVERIGTERARQAVEDADVALLVVEDGQPWSVDEMPRAPDLVVLNKADITGGAYGCRTLNGGEPGQGDASNGALQVAVSAITGAGLDALGEAIATAVGFSPAEDAFVARRRHLDAFARAAISIDAALALLEAGEDVDTVLVAEECRAAHRHLMVVTGQFGSEDLLAEIFSSFCIGK